MLLNKVIDLRLDEDDDGGVDNDDGHDDHDDDGHDNDGDDGHDDGHDGHDDDMMTMMPLKGPWGPFVPPW